MSGRNRLGEVAKETWQHAFSSVVVTTFLSEQDTGDVASLGILLYQRGPQRRPKEKRNPYGRLKTKLDAKRLERKPRKTKIPRPPARRAEAY